MSNGRNSRGRSKTDSSRDSGGFVALPWSVLDCPAYGELSHPARSLLMELARQYVRDNNGRLLTSMKHLRKRGWKSADVISRAKQELIACKLIHETVKGHRPNRASWYALTWFALDVHRDFDPGAAETFERGAYKRWAPKDKGLKPLRGIDGIVIAPSPGISIDCTTPSEGAIGPLNGRLPAPRNGNHLEMPISAGFDSQQAEGARILH
jgi:hypothetical protein